MAAQCAQENESQAGSVSERGVGTPEIEKRVFGGGKKLDALVAKREAAHPKARKQRSSKR